MQWDKVLAPRSGGDKAPTSHEQKQAPLLSSEAASSAAAPLADAATTAQRPGAAAAAATPPQPEMGPHRSSKWWIPGGASFKATRDFLFGMRS